MDTDRTLRTLFQKPVDRAIEGVIKADDEASLRLELEEYVLTNEVEKRLEAFVDAYLHDAGANGVWISGFFGSGKSHLLKMVALLLENRVIEGTSALELFLPKCQDNELLRGDLKRAVAIPSQSILFNIDQKADVISKTQIDALLAVFVKVFDERSGYYGKQGHIAQFERDLDSRGLYVAFQSAYQSIAGRPWQQGREQALLEGKHIAQAYAQVSGGTESEAAGILDKYRSQYHVSIEDFAAQVNAYIERQGPDFRLNFFVDEVGQYIADNVKLMTNLQTIAESLATKCRGRAWIVITAQEEMDSVVGELDKQQGHDFSKIQARFANRMKLTSADVAEVIQKRLLLKNDTGIEQLSVVYQQQANNFKTLFDFSDGAASYRNFQDRDHFIHSYPFIPYQFALFQSAIQHLSQHNAFEGKHSSVGERSMLGVFQQVAIQIAERPVGQLATFDRMFEGIRTALKSQIQRAIIQAENHLDNAFAIRLLKALFLIKYIKEFKASPRNLCVLMLEGFEQDLPALRRRVEAALNLLEQQTYVQRNGELYDYLTDEEKDVEQEIKNTEVETTDVAAELETLLFDQVIKQRKIRYDAGDTKASGQDYPFSRKLDDRLHGREYELAIHIISPFHEQAEHEDILRMQSMGRSELLILLPADERLVRDLLMTKRTEKYIRQNLSLTQQDSLKRILSDKAQQNQERQAEIQQRLRDLLGKAKLIVNAADLEISSSDGQTRVIRGFHELISRAYPNRRMLRGIAYSETDIASILAQSQQGLFGNDETALAESEQEVFAFIQSNGRGGVRTTVKGLLERFERKPYGWPYPALLCTLAKLCARGKVEVRSDGNLLEDAALERALRNSQAQGNLVLEPQVQFTASQVRALKTFHEDFFDAPPAAGEAKALGQDTATALQALIEQLQALAAQTTQYPFLSALTPALDTLNEIAGKPYGWYLTELPRQEDRLLDLKEDLIDPIRKFMSGPQRAIYDEARQFLHTQEPNFLYVEGAETAELSAALADPHCFKGSRVQQMKRQLEMLKAHVDEQVQQRRTQAIQVLKAMQARMQSMDEYQTLPEARQAELDQPYHDLIEHLGQQQLIAVINDRLHYFEDQGYQKLLAKMVALATPKPPPRDPDDHGHAGEPGKGKPGKPNEQTDHDATGSEQVAEPAIEYIPARQIQIAYDKAWLANEQDVERYLESMREALIAEIRKGKRVQV